MSLDTTRVVLRSSPAWVSSNIWRKAEHGPRLWCMLLLTMVIGCGLLLSTTWCHMFPLGDEEIRTIMTRRTRAAKRTEKAQKSGRTRTTIITMITMTAISAQNRRQELELEELGNKRNQNNHKRNTTLRVAQMEGRSHQRWTPHRRPKRCDPEQ